MLDRDESRRPSERSVSRHQQRRGKTIGLILSQPRIFLPGMSMQEKMPQFMRRVEPATLSRLP